jgi:hypothetical protein
MCSGTHDAARLFAIASSLWAVVRMNHAGRAYWISGSSSAR